MPSKFGVPKYIKGKRNPVYWRRSNAAQRQKQAYADYQTRWRANNRERCAEYTRQYRARNSDKWEKWRERDAKCRRERRANDPEFRKREYRTVRASFFRVHYGITLEDYAALLKKQNGRCAICKCRHKEERYKRLHVDHDHKTTAVRALLCHSCNQILAYAKDNPLVLKAAIAYLKRFSRIARGS